MQKMWGTVQGMNVELLAHNDILFIRRYASKL